MATLNNTYLQATVAAVQEAMLTLQESATALFPDEEQRERKRQLQEVPVLPDLQSWLKRHPLH